jgi:hypothetical protein
MDISSATQPVTALLAALEGTHDNFVELLDSLKVRNQDLVTVGQGAIMLFESAKFTVVLRKLLSNLAAPRTKNQELAQAGKESIDKLQLQDFRGALNELLSSIDSDSSDPLDDTTFGNTVLKLFETLTEVGCPQCVAAYFDVIGTERDNGESSVRFSSPESLMKALEYRPDLPRVLSVSDPIAFGPLLRAYRKISGLELQNRLARYRGWGNSGVMYLLLMRDDPNDVEEDFLFYAYMYPRRFLDLVYENVDTKLEQEAETVTLRDKARFADIMDNFAYMDMPRERIEEIANESQFPVIRGGDLNLDNSVSVVCRAINEGDASLTRSLLYSSIFGRYCKTRYARKVFFANIVDCLVSKGWSELLREVLQNFSIARLYAKYYRGELLSLARLFAPNNSELEEVL